MKIIKTESIHLISGYVNDDGCLIADESTKFNKVLVDESYLLDCLDDIPRKGYSKFEITIKVKVTSDE